MSGKVVHVLGRKPYDLYVGRAMPRYGLAASPLRNEHKIGRDGTRDDVLRMYEKDLRRNLDLRPDTCLPLLADVRGKTLACWCAPKSGVLTPEDPEVCHGQILLRLAEEASQRR